MFVHRLPMISIHALLAESDSTSSILRQRASDFYPRSPCGERPGAGDGLGHIRDFYPRSPCGERPDKGSAAFNDLRFLSTLSLRRATCGERLPCASWPFLSTLSLRRATFSYAHCSQRSDYFYPRSPCGERRFCLTLEGHKTQISIHALLAKSDAPSKPRAWGHRYFYPRSPCGERHNINSSVTTADKISIHALLAESDRHGPPCI